MLITQVARRSSLQASTSLPLRLSARNRSHLRLFQTPFWKVSFHTLPVRRVKSTPTLAPFRTSTSRAPTSGTMPETRSHESLVWIDCEMTGLDHENDTILSIACFVTDAQLNLLDEKGYEAIIHHDEAALTRMDDWCTNTHKGTGLWKAALASTTTAETAARECVEYIQKYAPDKRKALLAGNSVGQDRSFLQKGPWKPIVSHLHYRVMDVSTIKEAAARWSPPEVVDGTPPKTGVHRARDDIMESIAEARYYMVTIFRPATLQQPGSEGTEA